MHWYLYGEGTGEEAPQEGHLSYSLGHERLVQQQQQGQQ
jgi:hypothetical protein